ncbi:hypothetical protein RAC89_15755 [Paenibacillus sp. GD4]|jgi:hypothetical protein|uniref:hypothetical protein n=1 Tax=Paenibacillus sp. GD4 TaxID=3068890 RepID=UPI002796911D|nr:hypothetical protein [Paenibacillus sp. GD4]MDQ1911859.1 hypothetical protein [Paenibacillus sp. GD4]
MSKKEVILIHIKSSLTALSLLILFGAFPMPAMAAVTPPPAPSSIRIDNRVSGTADVVTVTGLLPDDVVKLYADATTAAVLSTAAVPSGATSAVLSVAELGADGGHVYVTVTRTGYSESRRVVKSVRSEPETAAPAASSIRIDNQPAGTNDNVNVRGLAPGDIAKVYSVKEGGVPLGTATAMIGSDTVVISVAQLGSGEGVAYVSLTETGKRESRRTEKGFKGEPLTEAPSLSSIEVTNAIAGMADTVKVSGLQPGDVLRAYSSDTVSTPLASATAAAGATHALLSVPQLGTANGYIYVTLTRPPYQESRRIAKGYKSEPPSVKLSPGQISIQNRTVGTDDLIEVVELSAGDLIKIYADESMNTLLGSGTVSPGGSGVKIQVSQVGSGAGKVYATLTSNGRVESAATAKSFAAEPASAPPERSLIEIVNRAEPDQDTVTISGISSGNRVKVYRDDTSLSPIAQGVVPAGAVSITLSIPQLGTGYSVVYVTLTRGQEQESPRKPKIYAAEPQSLPPSLSRIQVMNHSGAADEVTVSGLLPSDKVRLYRDSAAGTLLLTKDGQPAEAIVAEGETSVRIGKLQLQAEGSTVYVTVTSTGKQESRRVSKIYEAE